MPLKLAFTRDNLFEVNAMRALLASHGIDSLLKNEFSSSIAGEVPFSESWPQIWVVDEEFESALLLLQQAATAGDQCNEGKDWACLACEEENPVTFELCWSCGELRDLNG